MEPFEALEEIARRFKSYEREPSWSPSAPDTSKFRATHSGFLRAFEHEVIFEEMFPRLVIAGLKIGAVFAQPLESREGEPYAEWQRHREARKKVVNQVEAEARAILLPVIKEKGGFLLEKYGSNYSTIGWAREHK